MVEHLINYVARRATFDQDHACGMAVKKQARRDATAIQHSSWTVYWSAVLLSAIGSFVSTSAASFANRKMTRAFIVYLPALIIMLLK